MTCPGRETNPGLTGGRRAIFTNSLLIFIRNMYIWARNQWRMLTTVRLPFSLTKAQRFFSLWMLSYPGKYLDIVERVLCLEGVLARVECDKAAAAAHPRRLVAQHVQLVHGTELLHAHLIKGTLRTKQNSGKWFKAINSCEWLKG